MDIQFIFVVLGAAAVGYVVPVLLSLMFILLTGMIAPKLISQESRIKPGFLLLDGLVWLLGATVAGYLTGILIVDLPWVGLLGSGTFLIALIWSNRGEMKKVQSMWRLVGLTAGTVVGLAGGLELFWLTYPAR